MFSVSLFFVLSGLLTLTVFVVELETGSVLSCYLSSWAVYRSGSGSFQIENIDPSLCSHVIYAFAGLNTSDFTIRSLDPWQDLSDNYGKGGYKRAAVDLKIRNPNLKVLIAIGGWNEGSINYSLLARNAVHRQRFIQSVLEFIKKYSFDGLDLDWEYPGKRNGIPVDKENFLRLVQELKFEFAKHKYLLTAAFGASKEIIDVAYDIEKLSKSLDLLHIMCYDYHGAWDRKVGPNAPLYGINDLDNLSINYTVGYLKMLNVDLDKVVLGVPFYGRTFLAESNNFNESELQKLTIKTLENGFPGIYTKENGFMGFNEICLEQEKNSTWTNMWHNESHTPFLYKTNQVISYDSVRSLQEKVRFAMKEKLAGVMVWSIDTDDFNGHCRITGNRKFPLLRAINEELENFDRTNFKAKNGSESDPGFSHNPNSAFNSLPNFFWIFLLLKISVFV